MSLSRLLRAKSSALRALFQECLPHTRAFVTALNADLRTSPVSDANPLTPNLRGLSGTAIDYRLRLYFGIPTISETVAWAGAARLETNLLEISDTPAFGTFLELVSELERDIVDLSPVGARLTAANELRLARDCVVLSYFDQFFRSGFSLVFDRAQSGSLQSGADVLALPPKEVVNDVARMSTAFFESQYPLLVDRPVVLNPVFEGSSDFGGADGDMIAGDSLIDFKSTAKSTGPLDSNDLYQLLAYPCLDYSDRYRIRKVGFSVVRRDALREWDIEELVSVLSRGKTSYGTLRERVKAFAISSSQIR